MNTEYNLFDALDARLGAVADHQDVKVDSGENVAITSRYINTDAHSFYVRRISYVDGCRKGQLIIKIFARDGVDCWTAYVERDGAIKRSNVGFPEADLRAAVG